MSDSQFCKRCNGFGETETIEYSSKDPESYTTHRESCPYCLNGLKAHTMSPRKFEITPEEATARAIKAIEQWNDVFTEEDKPKRRSNQLPF